MKVRRFLVALVLMLVAVLAISEVVSPQMVGTCPQTGSTLPLPCGG